MKDQLSTFGEVEVKKMFGGFGFFKEGCMFGMIGNNVFRLKVDASNEKDFIEKGMKPYHSDTRKKGMPYWEVAVDILESKPYLARWAEKSFNIAKQSAAGKK